MEIGGKIKGWENKNKNKGGEMIGGQAEEWQLNILYKAMFSEYLWPLKTLLQL